MQHLIFSCLESRVEDNGALFGRYLLGPLRIGQATTLATALRRSLLSEVQSTAITAVEINGACHQYSSIKGVRESALDIILNLKQVVLSGTITQDLPAIGYLEVQGPRAVIANDLVLPNGICCVNTNQLIATLSANGLLKMKFLISGGKSCITPSFIHFSEKCKGGGQRTPYTESVHTISKKIFTPKTYWRETEKLPLYGRKQLKQLRERNSQPPGGAPRWPGVRWPPPANEGVALKTPTPTDLLLNKQLSNTIWGREQPVPSKSTLCEPNKVIVYNQKRRSNVTFPLAVQSFSRNLSLSATGNSLSLAQNYSSAIFFKSYQKTKDVQPLNSPQDALFSINEKHIAAVAAKKFNRRLHSPEFKRFVKDCIKPIFYAKPIETVFSNPSLKVKPNPLKKEEKRFILPVDPVFSPITRVNFAIQIDDQWQEPRERIVFEIWSNGSIHPRQAISEAATNLVYLFSLLR